MKNITVNKKALHEYEILEKFEAGMALTGSEVKSIREGKVNLKDAYVLIRQREAFLINSHISAYSNASYNNHEPERERKLLLNRKEIMKLDKKVRERGFSIVALRMYFSDKGYIKLEIALAKGKRLWEKKQKIKERDIKRETDREMKYFKS
jgi:SsrA-binding protein